MSASVGMSSDGCEVEDMWYEKDRAAVAFVPAGTGSLTGMIDAILPAVVTSFAAFHDDPAIAILPEEMALVAAATESRQEEFITGRYCARQALRRLGQPDAALLRGAGREPLWPAGIVGSITHCPGYRAAAVAHDCDIFTIGIDAEICAPLPAGVPELVLVDAERHWLATMSADFPWDRLIFSAKESVFKAWWPLTRVWLDFSAATINLQPDNGTFHAELAPQLWHISARQITGFAGRFLIRDGFILTAIAAY